MLILFLLKIISSALQLLIFGPLVVLPPLRVIQEEVRHVNVMVTVWIAANIALSALIAVMPTGRFEPNAFERFVRQVYVLT